MYSDDVYVIFTKAKTLGWISRFLHSEISHCFVMWNNGNNWICYDTDIDKVDICTASSMGDIIDESYIVKVKKQKVEGGLIVMNTCVSSVKRFIGLRDRFILTPYQLYQRLNHGNI